MNLATIHHSKEKVLICDFDETLIKEDLEKEFVSFYVKNHLGALDCFLALFTIPINKVFKIFHLGGVLKSWTFDKSPQQLNKFYEEFMNTSKINLNKNVLDFVRCYQGKKVLLTGCHQSLVNFFLKKYKIDNTFDEVIGSITKCNGLVIKRHPFGKSKLNFINAPDVGIGNSIFDRYFLEECKVSYVVNPDKELATYADKYGWKEL